MLNVLDKRFVSEKGIMILPVKKPQIQELIYDVASENNLVEKEETHISIIVTKNARVVLEKITDNGNPEKTKKELLSLLNSFTWKYALTDEYFLQENSYTKNELLESGYIDLTEHIRRTVIRLIDVPDIDLFYKQLNDLLETSLSVPVPHITLFTWSDYEPMMKRGIGINSKEEFDSYTQKKIAIMKK